ncbi:hypothetical protein F2Q69_00025369 [Brassica cretica]|uniref:DET1- and DDB1-associated protein 1 domain-containing protein n=1 Tax=Brassica cretica TaxID=69181 RepID=A0A8S9QGM2_BRACR|nr:hypothetical protein F2Q69_00025369 [Brassica cretica]
MMGSFRVYICEHDTSPPEGQQIRTNQQNILIRSLSLKKQKGDSSSKKRRVKQWYKRKRLSVFDCGEAPCPSQGERPSNKRKKGKSKNIFHYIVDEIIARLKDAN